MKISNVKTAIAEAERFIERAKAAVDKAHRDNVQDEMYYPNKENAACKRASLDLTRALADMRRGGE